MGPSKKPMQYLRNIYEATPDLHPGVEASGPDSAKLCCVAVPITHVPTEERYILCRPTSSWILQPSCHSSQHSFPRTKTSQEGSFGCLSIPELLPRGRTALGFKMWASCCCHVAPGEEPGSGLESWAALPAQRCSRGN